MKSFMTSFFIMVLTTFICTACCSRAFGADLQATPANPQMQSTDKILTRLPNGLLVYIFKDSRFPLTATRLYVRVGSADEKASQAGISHVLEHMVFKGTDHRPKGAVAKEVESLGGYLNAATSFDKTWYITDMPSMHWRTGLDVVKDMAFGAVLDPKELDAEKEVVISELQRGEDSPMRKLYEKLQMAALNNSPYGRPIIGFENTIRSLTTEDLKNWVKDWYQPQNMMLLVGGDIEPAVVLEYAQKLFGDLKNSSDLPVRGPIDLKTAALGSPRIESSTGPWNKVYLGVSMPAPALKDLRSTDLDALCFLLAGDGTSTFYQKYKHDLQLVDSISVDNMSLARGGMLSFTAQLDPEKLEEFWTKFTDDLATLNANNFNSDAIARARLNMEDDLVRAGETLNGRVALQGMVEFELGGVQGEENLRFAQRNVDVPQLENAIKSWIDSSQARVRVLVPENTVLPDLTAIMNKNWPQTETAASSETLAKEEEKEIVNLGNGCALALLPDKNAPYIAIDLLMPGGNSLLKADQQGLAYLVASLLTDGAGDYNKLAIDRWLSERAASLSARSGIQTFAISLTGPSRFNADYFVLLREIIRRPKFANDELKREVDNMKSALKQRNDNPLSYMFAKLNPFLFPDGQLYGYDNLGEEANLNSFNSVAVRDFWTKQSAMPWILAIAGDFDREKILDSVKNLPPPHMQPKKLEPPVWGENKQLNLTLPGRNQAHLLQVFKTVPPDHPHAPALMLLQSILAGQSGLLFTELRDKEGLGYTVTAFNRSMPMAGFMAFYIGTTADKIEQAKEGFTKIIERLKNEDLDPSLLQAGTNSLWGDYVRGSQSLSSRASEVSKDYILHYPADFQKLQIEKTRSLSPAELREVAKLYLNNPYDVTLLP